MVKLACLESNKTCSFANTLSLFNMPPMHCSKLARHTILGFALAPNFISSLGFKAFLGY